MFFYVFVIVVFIVFIILPSPRKQATGSRLGLIVQAITTLCIGVGLAMYYDWRLGLTTLPFMPVVLLSVYFQTKMLTGQNMSEARVIDEASKVS